MKNFDLNKHKQLKISYNIKNYYFAKLYEKYADKTICCDDATVEQTVTKIVAAAEECCRNNRL